MVAKPLYPLYKNIIKPLDRVRYPELRYTLRKGGHGKEYGLLAQEVEKVFPNLVVTDNEGKKLINYTELIPVLINAVQQQSSEVEELKGKISK